MYGLAQENRMAATRLPTPCPAMSTQCRRSLCFGRLTQKWMVCSPVPRPSPRSLKIPECTTPPLALTWFPAKALSSADLGSRTTLTYITPWLLLLKAACHWLDSGRDTKEDWRDKLGVGMINCFWHLLIIHGRVWHGRKLMP